MQKVYEWIKKIYAVDELQGYSDEATFTFEYNPEEVFWINEEELTIIQEKLTKSV